ncbi:MAG: TerB family tellurite resistance protein [Acidobacteria bacterium]|nr:TerB family tellurite resistance protein [Acidobacteriota bacterium]
MQPREAIASLQLLVAVAKADGKIEESEREALEDAIKDLALPEGYTVDKLLSQEVILESVLNEIKSSESQKNAFKSAYLLANADGDFSKIEKHLIKMLETRWNISPEEIAELNNIINISNMVVSSDTTTEVENPELAGQKTLKTYLVINTLLGAIPVPLVADALILTSQMSMIIDIGKIYGYDTDRTLAKAIIVSLGIGTGASIAVSSLAKLVPGWGSVVGATVAFSTTYALGHVAVKYFESGKNIPLNSLKDIYQAKKSEGKKEYEKSRSTIEENKHIANKLEELSKALKDGKLTQDKYQEEVNRIKENL